MNESKNEPTKPGLLCEDANAIEGHDATGKPVIEKTLDRDADVKSRELHTGYGGGPNTAPAARTQAGSKYQYPKHDGD